MAPTATAPPTIPPRPSRSQDRDAMPKIPPRPTNRRIERSVSPNPARFAPSPLNEGNYLSKNQRSSRLSPGDYNGNNGNRRQSVELPSVVGEEGREYDSLAEQLSSAYSDMSSSPEQTRTIGDDVKIHAPKPSLPAQSAKQRVMAVTRTDSDRAASYGIGRPSSEDPHVASSNRSLKKKASTASQLSTSESHIDDEQGIPEIGQQVPMFPNAGDVQAPSPAPGTSGITEGLKDKNHKRRTSARGNLPPGSYGLHGHGVAALDKLEKAYFQKHPELLKKEHTPHHYDRPQDFSMSSEDLNKIVRDTASRGSGLAVRNYAGTPSDQVGWQAIEESTSRVTSPRPSSSAPKSPGKQAGQPETASKAQEVGHRGPEEGNVIHVDEPGRRRSVMFSDEESSSHEQEDEPMYSAPILAEDEVAKGPSPDHGPAVEPRRNSAFEEELHSRPSSRPNSRPASLYKITSYEQQQTPLEDVEEYEPLFPEDEKKAAEKKVNDQKLRPQGLHKQRFPSRDIWEDAPDSVHYTVEVSTPEISEETDEPKESKAARTAVPAPREGETPAQAFARHQEELAEREAKKFGPDTFLKHPNHKPPLWAQHQPHLAAETTRSADGGRPGMGQRFPSRDVWEDTPDSLMLETTVSTPQQDRETESPVERPEVPPQRPVRKGTDPDKSASASPVERKPSIPERPKPKTAAEGEDAAATSTSKPPLVPDRPKPAVPARPVKAGPTSGGLEPAEAAAPPRQKPAVPARPAVGSKIAALQGSFLSDLNKKLGLGPQAPKKEEPAEAAEAEGKAVEEKAPLADARKGRARGPQRRAPAAKSPSPAPVEEDKGKFSLGFAVPETVFEIDPEEEEGAVRVASVVKREDGKADAPAPAVKESGPKEEMEPQRTAAGGDAEMERTTDVVAGEDTPIVEGDEKEDEEPETKEEEEEEDEGEAPVKEEKQSLVSNTAGETIVTEEVKKDEETGKVEPVSVEE